MNNAAFALASVTSVPVAGHLMAGVILGGWLSRVLAHLTSFYIDIGEAAAFCTRSRCAVFRAFLMVFVFLFLASRYASHDSSVCSWLCLRFSLLASARTSEHSLSHPSLALGDRLTAGSTCYTAVWITLTILAMYLSSAVLVRGLSGGGSISSIFFRSI